MATARLGVYQVASPQGMGIADASMVHVAGAAVTAITDLLNQIYEY